MHYKPNRDHHFKIDNFNFILFLMSGNFDQRSWISLHIFKDRWTTNFFFFNSWYYFSLWWKLREVGFLSPNYLFFGIEDFKNTQGLCIKIIEMHSISFFLSYLFLLYNIFFNQDFSYIKYIFFYFLTVKKIIFLYYFEFISMLAWFWKPPPFCLFNKFLDLLKT